MRTNWLSRLRTKCLARAGWLTMARRTAIWKPGSCLGGVRPRIRSATPFRAITLMNVAIRWVLGGRVPPTAEGRLAISEARLLRAQYTINNEVKRSRSAQILHTVNTVWKVRHFAPTLALALMEVQQLNR